MRVGQKLERGLMLLFRCGKCCCPVILSLIGLVILVLLAVIMIGTQSMYRVDFTQKETLSSTVTSGRLSNGLKWMAAYNPYKPGVFTSYLCVQVGSVNEDDDIQGIAHFVEHIAFDQTRDYMGRNAMMREIMRDGAQFNAFTSFRTTCYQLWDMPKDKFELGQMIHKNQVLYQMPNQTNMNIEKGAVLGEARYRNGSDFVAMVDMLNNHGGGGWRIPQRFPIGIADQIKNFTTAQVQYFIDKWYRLDRMRMLIAGDIDTSTANDIINSVWGNEKVRDSQKPTSNPPDIGESKPSSPFFIKEVLGIDGVDFNLLLTSSLESHPFTANTLRQHTLNKLFSITYGLQIEAMLRYNYDWERDIKYGGRSAGVAIENDYSLGVTLRAFSVSSPGNAQTGTWKSDWEMALTELRRLALRGPPAALVVGIMYVVSGMFEGEAKMSGYMDSNTVVDLMLGDMDPGYVYQDLAQRYETERQFLGLGYVRAAQLHIQAEAQVLWKTLVELATEKEYNDGDFGGLKSYTSSLNVFMDVGNPAGSHISKEAILAVIRKVHNAATPDGLERVLSEMVDLSPTEGVPASGYLVEPSKLSSTTKVAPAALDENEESGVQRYKLANGIIVNFKPSLSGSAKAPAGPPGELLLQVASLGGKSTQTPILHGACELVNLHVDSGNSVIYSKDDGVDYNAETAGRYLSGVGAGASITCALEEMVISSRLSSACENHPSPTCSRTAQKNYFRALEAVRLAMNPLFDDTSIERAVDILEAREADLLRTADPMSLVSQTVDPQLLQLAFPNDSRLAPVTSSVVKKLNPYDVEMWVREQFTPDRIEINVVGDANRETLLLYLNYVLGSIVKGEENATLIGYDIYNITAAPNFIRNFAENSQPTHLECVVPSVSPNRGYAVVYGKTLDYYEHTNDTSPRGVAIMLASNAAATLWAMWNVRVLQGYGYFAMVSAHHSMLFPGFGYYRVEWAPGDYPTPAKSDDNLNLAGSIDYVASHVFANISTDIVKDSLQQLKLQTHTRFATNTYWLDAIRGISLKPPAWVGLSRDFVKPMHATDVLGALETLGDDLGPVISAMDDGISLWSSLATIPTPTPTSKPTLVCK